jgi:hypothetical protein
MAGMDARGSKLLRNHYPAVAIFNNGQANQGQTEKETEIEAKHRQVSYSFLSLSSWKNKDVNHAKIKASINHLIKSFLN